LSRICGDKRNLIGKKKKDPPADWNNNAIAITMCRNGFPGMAHTGAARAGVFNMTQSLCVEWARYGVRVNCVSPGTILGKGLTNYPEMVQHMIARFTGENPSGRMGTEEEVSSAIVYLLSPAASYINGACIKVDGGSSLLRGVVGQLGFPEESKIHLFRALPDNLQPKLTPVFEEIAKKYPKKESKL
jgi:hypothetical protein